MPHRSSPRTRWSVSFAPPALAVALLGGLIVSSGACARSEFSPDDSSGGAGTGGANAAGASSSAGTGGSTNNAGTGGSAGDGSGDAGAAGKGGSGTAGKGGSGGSGTAGKGGSGTAGKGGSSTAKGCVLVINELCPQAASGTTEATDEYVELYNAGDATCDVDGWSLKYRSDKNGTGGDLWVGGSGDTIGPGDFFVIAGGKFIGSSDADYTGSVSTSKDGGGVGLVDDGDNVIDSIAYGTAQSDNDYAEGDVAAKVSIGSCLSRTPDGNDSDDNAQDFIETDPTPGASN
jgi:hypothetical protein